MEIKRNAFKAYDIRGRVPDELNEEMAYRIGRVFVEMLSAKKVVIGHDVRQSSEAISAALANGLTDAGCDVVDIGLCGTEMIYFATSHLAMDGGIMVTASHNPIDYNGLKLVRAGSKPISADTGLKDIEEKVVTGSFIHEVVSGAVKGTVRSVNIMDDYIAHLLTYVDMAHLKPLKIVVNAGNGCAGPTMDMLAKYLPFEIIKINNTPDGTFPNGIPNPILMENREATARIVHEQGADLGVAWDGDFDRCFLFDERGHFIEGYYIVGFLGQAFARKLPGAKVIHDPRLTWNTIELVESTGGEAVQCKSGHAFMKECLRNVDGVYGGEMSAHHYFRDFFYCDSGMVPWLLVVESMCIEGKKLSALVDERIAKYPVSGEINRRVADSKAVLAKIEEKYVVPEAKVEYVDGLSVEYADWRFNVRMSNTEPVMRLNVESRADMQLMESKTAELLELIGGTEG